MLENTHRLIACALVWASVAAGCDGVQLDLDAGLERDAGRASPRVDAGPRPDAGPPPVCGNGEVERGEACDDGNDVGGDGCESYCGVCGDGIRQSGEGCDPGPLPVDPEPNGRCRPDCRTSGQRMWSLPLDEIGGAAITVLQDGTTVLATITDSTTLRVFEIDVRGTLSSMETAALPASRMRFRVRDIADLEDGRLMIVGDQGDAYPYAPWMTVIHRSPFSVMEIPVPRLSPDAATAGYLRYVRRYDDGELAVIGHVGPIPPYGDHDIVQIRIRSLDPLEISTHVAEVVGIGQLGDPTVYPDGRVVVPAEPYNLWYGDNSLAFFDADGVPGTTHEIDVGGRRVLASAVTARGALYLGGTRHWSSQADAWWVWSYSPVTREFVGRPTEGTPEWLSSVTMMEPDPWGGVLFAGSAGAETTRAFVARISATGDLAWMEPTAHTSPLDMATDPLTQNVMIAFRGVASPVFVECWRP